MKLDSPSDLRVLRLETSQLILQCAPELGGRVFSLVNRRSGREWLWRRPETPQLFRPTDAADFSTGCFAGLDECVPSVGACVAPDGRRIVDHGVFWAKPWTVAAQSENGFTLAVAAAEFGLTFTRKATVDGSCVRFEYTLANGSSAPAPALWCMHPLFTWAAGDCLQLASDIATLSVQGVQPALPPNHRVAEGTRDQRPVISYPEFVPGVRLDELALADNENGFLKAFSARIKTAEGTAALWNRKTGDRLDVRWDAVAAPYLGIWLTRGGYRGWHHVALEPTNAPHDHFSVAVNETKLTSAVTLPAGARRTWWVEWRVT